MTVFTVTEEMSPKKEIDQSENVKCNDNEVQKDDPDSEEGKLDIPGLKNVWNSKYTLIGKLIWMIILLSCTIMMLIHVINRIQFYQSNPVSVGVRIENNQSMMYPAITLCSTVYWNSTTYRKIQEDVANKSGIQPYTSVVMDDILQYMNIMELWEKTAYRLSDFLHTCMFGEISCDTFGEWKPMTCVLGICYTYSPHQPINASGSMYGMKLLLKSASKGSSWKILIHSPHDSPKAKLFTEGISISAGFLTEIRIRLRQFRMKSTASKPCRTNHTSDCDVNCLSDMILQKHNCRLPFMEYADAPYCAPPKHFVATQLLENTLLGQGNQCTCLPECKSDRYETNADSAYFPDRPITQVRLFYENFQYTTISEEFSYGFVSLLSDIGGTLGLFLGFSILTVVEIVETLVVKLKQTYRKKKNSKNQAKK